MRLMEFTKPDYDKMSEDDLSNLLWERLNNLEREIDKSNKEIENGLRRKNTNNLREVSST